MLEVEVEQLSSKLSIIMNIKKYGEYITVLLYTVAIAVEVGDDSSLIWELIHSYEPVSLGRAVTRYTGKLQQQSGPYKDILELNDKARGTLATYYAISFYFILINIICSYV